MNWETITNWISQFFDKKIVIAIATILAALGCGLIMLSRTSFGKRAIVKLTTLYELGLKKANDTEEKVKAVQKLAEEKISELEGYYEQRIAVVISTVNFYEESTFALFELVPNKKVQEKLAEVKEQYKAKKELITSIIGEIYEDFEIAVEKKEKEIRQEYEDKIAYLENQIANINLYFQNLKEEKVDEQEREETENSDPIEETV